MICYSGLVLSMGFAVGVFLALMSSNVQERPATIIVQDNRLVRREDSYGVWFENLGVSRRNLDFDRSSFDPKFNTADLSLEADVLYKAIPVACAVLSQNVHNSYAVSSSWGSKCNSVQFYSDKIDEYLKTVRIPARPGTWEFLCLTIRDLAARVPASWYVFSKDDVYFIPENLRYIVAHKDPTKAFYLGRLALLWGTLYNTGQTAFVLSRGAIELLSANFNSSSSCRQSSNYRNNEDHLLGKYLNELGVNAEDTRDEEGRERFHVFTPAQLLAPGHDGIFKKYFSRSVNPSVQGKHGFSTTSVSFHGIQQDYIFLYEFLLYHVKCFNYNGGHGNNLSRIYRPSDHIWKSFVRDSLGREYNVSRVGALEYYKLWELWDPPEEFNRKLRDQFLNKTS